MIAIIYFTVHTDLKEQNFTKTCPLEPGMFNTVVIKKKHEAKQYGFVLVLPVCEIHIACNRIF